MSTDRLIPGKKQVIFEEKQLAGFTRNIVKNQIPA
jgi:hypothetical protein